MNLLEMVAGIFKPAAKLIDEMHTSEDERLKRKADLLEVQATVIQHAIQYERQNLKDRAEIVKAEAQSDHWLAANWRPMVMLTFCALAVGDSLGLLASDLSPQAWTLLQLGIGGYVVGRSGEKIAKGIIQARVTGK